MVRVVVRRRATPDEIRAALEKAGGEEAEELLRAYKEYEEEGETTYVLTYEIPPKVARRILSPKMLKLIEQISMYRMSITDHARMLGRSPPNVYNDLKFLREHGLIIFEVLGGIKVPVLLLEEIRIIV